MGFTLISPYSVSKRFHNSFVDRMLETFCVIPLNYKRTYGQHNYVDLKGTPIMNTDDISVSYTTNVWLERI